MSVRRWFVRDDGRLHPPWRMLLFFVIAILALIPIGLVSQIIGYVWDRSTMPWHPDPIALFGFIASMALLAAHWAMLRIDRRPWQFVHLDALAAKPAVLARGWVIGAMTIALPSALLLGVHWLAIRREPPGSWLSAATTVSVGLLPAALWEELLMRGYLFATLREWLGWRTAMLVSSVAFGLMHLSNPGADLQSVTMVFLAGLLLAGVVVATDSLYAAWMAHWAWNWIMAVPLHVAVSGIPMSHPYYETVDAGPDWATGGMWGPEGGAFAGVSIVLVLAVWWWKLNGRGPSIGRSDDRRPITDNRRPKTDMTERIAVLGAGQMGNGIAHVFAQAGHPVTMIDISLDALRRARDTIAKNLDRQVKKGTVTAEAKQTILDRITPAESMDAMRGASVVIEAVTEQRELKFKLFGDVDRLADAGAILATNTSSISITEIAARTRRPEAVIGMHFMNPVPVMQLVEVIRGLATSDATAHKTMELARAVGKTPVEASDYPGFIANRILMPMINEAAYCLMEGVGTAEAIDTVMKLGMNHPMGPLALADFIGLDTCVAILDVLHQGLGDPKYRACPLLRKHVAAGWLGKKSGRGFYSY